MHLGIYALLIQFSQVGLIYQKAPIINSSRNSKFVSLFQLSVDNVLCFSELRKEFLKWLQIVVSLFSLKRQKRPFLLFFDGLERMCSKTTKSGGVTYCNLNWVPKVLPKVSKK